MLVEISNRLERGEPLDTILPDIPKHLRAAVDGALRAQITGAEVAEKLALHFKVGSAVVRGTAMFTMMLFRDETERELVAALMIPPDRVLGFAEVVSTAAKAHFESAKTH